MRSILGRFTLALCILQISISILSAQSNSEPLSERELMALVAGNSLSENVAHEIESRGLNFRISNQYRSLLSEAGGDGRVLKALENATTSGVSGNESSDSSGELLVQLSNAGKLMRNKQYEEAGEELTFALGNGGGPETGYVMGELLRVQEKNQESAYVYMEVLRRSPHFVEAHTKLSYILHDLGDSEGALREAKYVLSKDPNNAEAHRFAAIAFDDLENPAAAETEYREALRIKPDYAVVHYDLGIFYYSRQNWDESIKEYKKSIVLDPNDERAHFNLGHVYDDRGDMDSAIREYREAKRLNPNMISARENLGEALMDRNMNAEAVAEFRELEAIAPNFAMGHTSLGKALFNIWDFPGAEKEYRMAIELDPTDPKSHLGTGEIREEQRDYGGALDEYRRAERLDETSANAHRDVGKMLLALKDVPGALQELKYAANLIPNDFDVHEVYGQALAASGDVTGAIAEFKQAVVIDSKHAPPKLELGSAYERKGDWANAIDQFRLAAEIDYTADLQDQYKKAQDRLNQRIALLKASGKSAEAKSLETIVHLIRTEPGISEKLDADMEAGFAALVANHPDEGEMKYKEAIGLAEKLEPRDYRLATSLVRLAGIYAAKNDFAKAEAALQQALAENVKLYGEESPLTTEPLQALGSYALFRKDYKSAAEFTLRAVNVNEKSYGENSVKVADALRLVANVYVAQAAYDKAEPYLLRAVHINNPYIEQDKSGMYRLPTWSLCDLYDKWNKPEKADPLYRQMLVVLEKQYGTDSPFLLTTLTSEAKALRLLGRSAEATKMEERMKSIQAGSGQMEGAVLTPQR